MLKITFYKFVFVFLSISIFLSINNKSYSQAKLVKDIETIYDEYTRNNSSNPQNFTSIGSNTYFFAYNQNTSFSLWKTNGIETSLVKEISTGTYQDGVFPSYPEEGSVPSTILRTVKDGVLYFFMGQILWRSDGTEIGTFMVKDIRIGALSSNPESLISVNGILFFVADVGNWKGKELWKSDGTEAGTVMVKDIRVGTVGSNPESLTDVNGTLFFVADAGDGKGKELWRSDGTETGTFMVKDIHTGGNSNPSGLTNMNGTLYFRAARSAFELWKSDGTEAGTVMVKQITIHLPLGSNPSNMIAINSTLFFVGVDNTRGRELWKSDGTEVGTVLVKDINIGINNGLDAANFTNVNGALYFTANDGVRGSELWRSDGTEAGTNLIRDIWPGSSSSNPYYLTNCNGTLFFAATNSFDNKRLWKVNNTNAMLVDNINVSNPKYITNLNGIIVFSGYSSSTGRELWKSDNSNNTSLVKNIAGDARSTFPYDFKSHDGILYFNTDRSGIWKSDGTEIGTVFFNKEAGVFLPDDYYYFFRGKQLFRTKNNEENILKSFGQWDIPRSLTDVNGTLFFILDRDFQNTELWKSDGTEAGTVKVKVLNTQQSAQLLINVNGTLFFTNEDSTHGWELWKSDGTETGTHLIKDISVGTFGGINPNFGLSSYVVTDGGLYFISSLGELWKSDGTEVGTVLLKSTNNTTIVRELTNVNNVVFFTYYNSVSNNHDLWKSDGTEAGTIRVKETTSGYVTDVTPIFLTNVNGTLFFFLRDHTSRYTYDAKLWKSDGTEAGTIPLKTFYLNSRLSRFPVRHTLDVNGTLYFVANDGIHGYELWKSDGTEIGTNLVQDIISPGNMNITQICAIEDNIFFSGDDGIHGYELWKYSFCPEVIISSSINSSTNLIVGTTNFNQTFTQTGLTGVSTWSIFSGKLPNGLSLNPLTGEINGTPNVAGNFEYVVQVKQGNCYGSQKYNITVQCPSLLFNSNSNSQGIIGSTYNLNMGVSGNTQPVSYSITPNLPQGLTLDTNTGIISGTPTQLSNPLTYTVKASQSNNTCTNTQTFTLSIQCPNIIFNNIIANSPATIGSNYTLNASVSGNTQPVTYSISPNLPQGLTLDTNTGIISGIPTQSSSLTTYTITASQSNGICTKTQTYSFWVQCPNLVFNNSNSNAPIAYVGASYTLDASVSGNTQPITYSMGTTLPTGLTLNPSTGIISGIPTVPYMFSITCTVIASQSNGVCIRAKSYDLMVICPIMTFNTTSANPATLGSFYTLNASVSGNTQPVSYSITPNLPQGLTLDTNTGIISGVPTQLSNPLTYTVTALQGNSTCTKTQNYFISVQCPNITFNNISSMNAIVGTPYTLDVSVSGNTQPVSYSITPNLPQGLILNTNTGIISGTPTIVSNVINYTVTASQSSGICIKTQVYNFSVLGPVIEINVQELNFGDVLLLESIKKTILIKNKGSAPLILTNIDVNQKEFTYKLVGNNIINPNESRACELFFTPKEIKDYEGEVKIISNAINGNDLFVLKGKGVNPTEEIQVNINPNPINDKVYVNLLFATYGNYSIQIYNSSGSFIKSQEYFVDAPKKTLLINLFDCPSGMYFIEIIHPKGLKSLKIIKN